MLSSLSRGSPIEKLRWIFGLYDIHGDGYITKEEMNFVVTAVYELLGESTLPVVEATSAIDHVDKIFKLMDTDNDGVISFDEFCDWCQKVSESTYTCSLDSSLHVLLHCNLTLDSSPEKKRVDPLKDLE